MLLYLCPDVRLLVHHLHRTLLGQQLEAVSSDLLRQDAAVSLRELTALQEIHLVETHACVHGRVRLVRGWWWGSIEEEEGSYGVVVSNRKVVMV